MYNVIRRMAKTTSWRGACDQPDGLSAKAKGLRRYVVTNRAWRIVRSAWRPNKISCEQTLRKGRAGGTLEGLAHLDEFGIDRFSGGSGGPGPSRLPSCRSGFGSAPDYCDRQCQSLIEGEDLENHCQSASSLPLVLGPRIFALIHASSTRSTSYTFAQLGARNNREDGPNLYGHATDMGAICQWGSNLYGRENHSTNLGPSGTGRGRIRLMRVADRCACDTQR